MILGVFVLSLIAGAALLLAGYLFGLRRGRHARDGLRSHLRKARDEIVALQGRLAAAHSAQPPAPTEQLQQQLEATAGLVRAQAESFQTQLQQELRRVLQPLLEREAQGQSVREVVVDALGPFLERERLGHELARLDTGEKRGDLPRLLEAIAAKGGFSTMLLSDEVGLPLATTRDAAEVEGLAAAAAMFLTLSDRVAANGLPPPFGAVLRDQANRLILYRSFRVGEERYVLTAVTGGTFLSPESLDPTLGKIEALLSSQSWA
jgi:hypothetical protein